MAERNLNIRFTGDAAGIQTALKGASQAFRALSANQALAIKSANEFRTANFAAAKALQELNRIQQLSGKRSGYEAQLAQARAALTAQTTRLTQAEQNLAFAAKAKNDIYQQGLVTAKAWATANNNATRGLAALSQAENMAALKASLHTQATAASTAAVNTKTAATNANTAAVRVNTVAQQSNVNTVGAGSIALMSFTQGIQDASQFSLGMAQGIRAVTNNLQMFATSLAFAAQSAGGLKNALVAMGAAMKGPLGFLFAFSLASSALEFFSNRAQKAKSDAKELKDAVGSMYDVVGKPGNMALPIQTIRDAAEEAARQVADLERRIADLQNTGALNVVGMGAATGERAIDKPRIAGLEAELARARDELNAFKKDVDEFDEATTRLSRLLKFESVEDLKVAFANVRGILSEMGINPLKLTQDEFALLWHQMGDPQKAAEAFAKSLGSGGKKDAPLTVLQELQEETKALRKQQVEWATDGVLIAREESTIRFLEYELELLQRISRMTAIGLPQVAPSEMGFRGIDAIKTALPTATNLRTTPSVGALDPYAGWADPEWAKNYDKQLEEAQRATEQFANAISSAMVNAASDFAEGLGSMIAGTSEYSNVMDAALGTLADMAVNVGKIAIGTGVATLGIKKALETLNPWVAIAAGTALVALGSAVKGSLKQAASGGSTGSIASAAGISSAPGILVGTSGSTYSFVPAQRNLFGFSPASSLGATTGPYNRIEVVGTLRAEGRELVTVIRNETAAQRRQGITNPLGS